MATTMLPGEQSALFAVHRAAKGPPGLVLCGGGAVLDAMLGEILALPLQQTLIVRCRNQSKQLDRYVAGQRRPGGGAQRTRRRSAALSRNMPLDDAEQ